MSYCVNCGVKLAKSEKKCPLCATPVINPNKEIEDYEPAYPSKIETFQTLNFKYLAKFIILILIILASITVICDFIIFKTISWSIYVICSALYLSCHLSFLLNKNIYLSLTIELISSELFIFVIALLNNGLHWYLYLVLPFIFIVWLYAMLCTYLMKKKNNFLRRISICLMFSALALGVIEGGIDLYNNGVMYFTWSIYASIPILIISTLIFIVSYNKKLTDEIKQRMFI